MVQHSKFEESSRPILRPRIILVIIAALVAAGFSIYTARKISQKPEVQPAPVAVVPEVTTVTALGRLEPKGEIVKLSAPSSMEGNRVEKLLVKEGDPVKVGQVIAVLDSRDRMQAALQQAQEAVKVAQANLAKVEAGAKTGEIEAQKAEIARVQAQSLGDERAQTEALARLEAQWEGDKAAQRATLARLEAQLEGDKAAQRATINRLEAELGNAQIEFRRYQQLYKQGAIAQSLYDSKRLTVDTITQQLTEARAVLKRIDATTSKQIIEAKSNLQRITATGSKQINEARAVLARIQDTGSKQVSAASATLNQIAEVRPVDVAAAKAEIGRALAAQREAKEKLNQAYVNSPQEGVVFKINTRPGELVSTTEGIIDIGQTSQMMAVAEVYQSDVNKVRPGQQVRITSDSIPGELKGRVERIGWQVQRQDIINTDPSSNIDSRIIEVHIQLDQLSSRKAAKLSNLQVKTVIKL
jgi:HlyD family secretion protein